MSSRQYELALVGAVWKVRKWYPKVLTSTLRAGILKPLTSVDRLFRAAAEPGVAIVRLGCHLFSSAEMGDWVVKVPKTSHLWLDARFWRRPRAWLRQTYPQTYIHSRKSLVALTL